MKVFLVAAVAAFVVAQASAPAFATSRVNQAGTGLATPTKQSHATLRCNSAPSCNQLISKCVERNGNWNPEGYDKGQPIKGNCTGL